MSGLLDLLIPIASAAAFIALVVIGMRPAVRRHQRDMAEHYAAVAAGVRWVSERWGE